MNTLRRFAALAALVTAVLAAVVGTASAGRATNMAGFGWDPNQPRHSAPALASQDR